MTDKDKYKGPYLSTAGKVTREMGRLYRLWRLGKLTADELKSGIDALHKTREGMLGHELDQRLKELQERAKAAQTNNVVPMKRA
jgi:hypothetical protein